MKKLGLVAVIAVFILGGLLGRSLFPKTKDRIVQGPPTKPDTVYVDQIQVDTVTEWRDRFTTDTINLVHEVTLTDTVYLQPSEEFYGLFRLQVGEVLGDTTYAVLARLRADSLGVTRRDEVQKIFTTGYVRELNTETGALQIEFVEWPKPKGCNFGCRLLWGLGGAAVGVVAVSVF